jgi:hypothetical protein
MSEDAISAGLCKIHELSRLMVYYLVEPEGIFLK